MIPRSPGRRWTTLAAALAFIGITCADAFAQTPTLRVDIAQDAQTPPTTERDYCASPRVGFYVTTAGGATSDMWVRLMVGVALREKSDFLDGENPLSSFGVDIEALYNTFTGANSSYDWIPILEPDTNDTTSYRTAIAAKFPGIDGPFMRALQASDIDYTVETIPYDFPTTYSLLDTDTLATHVFNACNNGTGYSTTAVTGNNAYYEADAGDWWYAVPLGQSIESTNWKSWNQALENPWTSTQSEIARGRWFDTSRLREMAIEAMAPSPQEAQAFIMSPAYTDAVFSTAMVLTVQAVGIYHVDPNGLTSEGIPHITNSPSAPDNIRVLLSKLNIIDFKARKAEFASGDGGGSPRGNVALAASPRPKARPAASLLPTNGVTVRTTTGLSAQLSDPLYPMRIAYSTHPTEGVTFGSLSYDSVGVARLNGALTGLSQGTKVYIWGLWSEGYGESQPVFESYAFEVTVP